MKKLLFVITSSLMLVMVACGGSKKEKVKSFADTFAGYVNAGQLDSIKAIYPSFNFDSVSHVSTDSVKIGDSDGITRVNFGSGKWIEIEIGDSGNITVVNTKGIAAFPEDKFQLAVNTGMINDSTDDIKTQELLNDSTYFAWLNDKAKEYYDNALTLNAGKAKMGRVYGEGCYSWTMNCTITNNLPVKVDGNQYKIAYTVIGAGEESNNWRQSYFKRSTSGKDIEPGQSVTITISDKGDGIKNPTIEMQVPKNEDYWKSNKPTGKEYEEYLNSKK